ncbi:hypothetical protein YC2023_060988 [Brassica napus]
MVNRPKLEVEKFLYICTHQSFQKCIKKKCKYHTVKIYSSQEIDGCARSPEQFLSTLRSFFRLPEYQTRQTKQKLCGVGKNCYGTVHSRLCMSMSASGRKRLRDKPRYETTFLAPLVYLHRNSSLRANLREYHRRRRLNIISELQTTNELFTKFFDLVADSNPMLAQQWRNVRPRIHRDPTPEEQAELERQAEYKPHLMRLGID